MKPSPTIGLFGTCGPSRWRDRFLAAYAERGIAAFNPQVEHWTPACAAAENEHFRRDAILLFPVTAETTGFGGLAEVGLAVAEIERANRGKPADEARNLLVYVDPDCADPAANADQLRDSRRTRVLVTSKLAAFATDHVHLCTSLDDMLTRSLQLAAAMDCFSNSATQVTNGRRHD